MFRRRGKIEEIVPHGAAGHFNGILQTWFTSRLKFVSFLEGLQHVMWVACNVFVRLAEKYRCRTDLLDISPTRSATPERIPMIPI